MSFFTIALSQVEWVDSEGEKSYIFIKDQYDSLLAESKKYQSQLEKSKLELNKVQKELVNCKFYASKKSSSNYIINQIIPLKYEDDWVWFSIGIIGGFTLCQLLNI
ncbi:MAG: hypothetical protein CMF96_06255 [Candidatus Marinimicrobia bacterium]|nr:hypothetical protein [Candidatus Neomarinimicrobiota bacterium]|tara:strand:- start:933 stop:1250 length:318 start_codon:yes stop_codon:yes gene_type:complete